MVVVLLPGFAYPTSLHTVDVAGMVIYADGHSNLKWHINRANC